MTDRLKGFVVTLDHDIREDDAEEILNAIRMVKGVVSVKPVQANSDDDIIRSRVLSELRQKLLGIVYEKY